MNESSIRVRFAPSPTGYLHIGGLMTALYNFLVARHNSGVFILRVEDTDRSRFVPDALDDILEALNWTGLAYDEGPLVGGPHAPYFQSERGELYRSYAKKLVDDGHAYYAFDTPEEIESLKTRLRDSGADSWAYGFATRGHMRNSLALSRSETEELLESGAPYVIRLLVPAGEVIAFDDLIRGRVEIGADTLDDQVLVKSDGMPTYHLANVVDDHHMGVTHVIRGEEWLPSTPKHILLYRYLGWQPPRMAHQPLILSPSGGKLSKRKAAEQGIPVLVRQYREEGYEPESLINFLALLAWNPGDDRELFTLDELVEAFSIDRVGSAGVQFDLDKLRWFNQQTLRALPEESLVDRLDAVLRREGLVRERDYVRGVAHLMVERVSLLAQVPTEAPYLFERPQSYDRKTVEKRWTSETPGVLRGVASALRAMPSPWTESGLEDAIKAFSEHSGHKLGQILVPLRIALSGGAGGPGVYGMLALFGASESVARIEKALETIGSGPRIE